MTDRATLEKTLRQYNQEHLLKFWDELTAKEQQNLCENINNVVTPEVLSYFKTAQDSLSNNIEKLDDRMEPIPDENFGASLETSADILTDYKNKGLLKISANEIGVLLMAGGQGTRLGVSYPKGMFKVGLMSDKSLFEIQAERIRKLQQLAFDFTGQNGIITWYIMTSEHTMLPTKEYLQINNYFGLNSNDVFLFNQGKLPCFDFGGKILLSSKFELSQSPDGNGGLYRALKDQNIIQNMENRGVKYLHVHSVDNILVQVADPVFIGFCLSKRADSAAKVVKKTVPTEAVGVVCKVDNLFQVVEYSEITENTAELKNENGDLIFNAGNICNHFFTTEFLKKIAYEYETNLKLHVAKKKIPYVDQNGQLIKPKEPNGIKIEKFIFDVFQFTENFVIWEVPREIEFSALKNADDAGKDCPKTAKNDLYKLHKKYLQNVGAIVEGDEIEISPLLSYNGEGLEDFSGKTITSPCYLHSKEESF